MNWIEDLKITKRDYEEVIKERLLPLRTIIFCALMDFHPFFWIIGFLTELLEVEKQ